jgi:hypothetical protein
VSQVSVLVRYKGAIDRGGRTFQCNTATGVIPVLNCCGEVRTCSGPSAGDQQQQAARSY